MHQRSNSELNISKSNAILAASTTSPLTLEAIQVIKEFEQSKVEPVPLVVGQLYTLQLLPGKKPGKPTLKFAALNPISAELIMFKKASDF